MTKKELPTSVFKDSRFYYCLLVVFFVFFLLLSTIFSGNINNNLNPTRLAYDTGWYDLDGSEVDFDNLMTQDLVVINKVTNGSVINNKSLCFFTKNVYFTVYLNGTAIYDFHPNPPKIFGKAYGVFPHAVSLPVLADDGLLTMEIENIYPGKGGIVKEVCLSEGGNFLISEMQRSAPQFLICLVVFVFGFVLFIIGIAGRYFGEQRYEIMSMGGFAMVSSLWVSTETPFISLLTGIPVAIHFIDYMMLALLPLPTVLFSAYITSNRQSKTVLVVGLLSAINIFTSVLSTSLGKKDYHELLWISHGLLGATVLCVLYLFIKSIVLKRLKKGVVVVLAITFFTPLLVGSFEVIRYRINPSVYSTSGYFKYVMFFFIFTCSIYEFITLSEMSKKSQYAEIMEHIAYTDALTGLLNREAYNEEIDSKKDEEVKYTVVMLDMNHLKKVNDRLGHAVGDEYIKKLAEFIKASFKDAKSFRMGGDEFLVLSRLKSSNTEFQNCLANMNKGIEAYNQEKKAEIPLSVAIGYADYNSSKDRMEDVIRTADEHMYEQKKKMQMELGIRK